MHLKRLRGTQNKAIVFKSLSEALVWQRGGLATLGVFEFDVHVSAQSATPRLHVALPPTRHGQVNFKLAVPRGALLKLA